MNDPAPPEFPKPGALPRAQVPIYERDRNSIPPNVNFAVVAYRLAKDMNQNLAVLGGILIAVVLIYRIPGAVWPAVVAASGPNLLGILWRSKPAEDH